MRYKKALIIDDDDVDIYISKRMIVSASLAENIVTKTSSSQALDYLNNLAGEPESLPEIIFLDLNMPYMDGFDFLHEFSKMEKSVKEHCKIFVLTNALNPERTRIADIRNNTDVVQVLNKPLTLEALSNL